MTITGAGPSVELFSNRLEITNPGTPLISPTRFIDAPPRSRNEALAAFMRRMKLCEEQGTGIDKVVAAVEREQMPPPDFRVGNGRIEATRAILFAPVRFADMMIQERERACYQHAALRFLERGVLTNASLRQRFGLAGRDSAKVSQVIRLARERALIKPADPGSPAIRLRTLLGVTPATGPRRKLRAFVADRENPSPLGAFSPTAGNSRLATGWMP